MKKTFCDCCGDEMVYDEKVAVLNGKTNSVDMRMGEGSMRQFGVVVEISPKMMSNGEHVDVCAHCRWTMIDKLDPRPRPLQAPAAPMIEVKYEQISCPAHPLDYCNCEPVYRKVR